MAAATHITDEDALAEIVRGARVVAVIGMVDERKADRPAYRIPHACQERGMRVIPVNPKIETSLGEKAYPNLAAVPDRFDLVNVFRRSEDVPPHVDDILAAKPKSVWFQLGIRNDEAAQKLAEAGIKVVQDRCLMVEEGRMGR